MQLYCRSSLFWDVLHIVGSLLFVGLLDPEGGTDRLIQNVTKYLSMLCNMSEVHRSRLHRGRSVESHSCTCVCHTGMWGSSGIGLGIHL